MKSSLNNVSDSNLFQRRSISLRDILTVLFCRFWGMALVSGLIFMSVVVVTFMSQEIYLSKAKVMLRIGRENVSVDPTVVGPTMGISRSRENEINSELSILASRNVVEQVVDELGANVVLSDSYIATGEDATRRRQMAVRNIESNLRVTSDKKSNNISVQFYSTTPELAQQILDEILVVYQRRHIEIYRSQASLNFFKIRVDGLLEKIEAKESVLAAFQRENGIILPVRQKEQLVTQISNMQQRQYDIKRQIMLLYTRRDALQKSLAERSQYAVTSRVEGMPNRSAETLKTRLMDLRITEADIMASYPETSATRRQLLDPVRKSIKYIENSLKKEANTLTEEITSIDTGYQNIVESLRRTETALSELTVEQATIMPIFGEMQEQLDSMVDLEREINRMKREIGYDWDEYRQYRTGLQRSKVAEALDMDQISNVSIVQSATLAVYPISPDKPRNLALGLLISIMVGIGYAFIREHFDDTIKSSVDIADHLGQIVLADISAADFDKCNSEEMCSDASEETLAASVLACGSPAVERKMIALYQNIISLIGVNSPKVIQIISARPDEGSSVIVRELAKAVVGKLGKSLLLIDANRPGTQCSVFRTEPGIDWEEVGDRRIDNAIIAVGNTKLSLSVLSASTDVPSSVVDTSPFDEVLAELSEQFDFIIIDAPPASETAEGLILSSKVSGTILVVEAGKTRWQVSDSVQKRIAKYGGGVLGVILNKRRNYIPCSIYNRL